MQKADHAGELRRLLSESLLTDRPAPIAREYADLIVAEILAVVEEAATRTQLHQVTCTATLHPTDLDTQE